ncbi:MAG: peptidoglycan bridge formation glycyltransferase FemA/FemB family protein [Anaerolineaceae bacterium]
MIPAKIDDASWDGHLTKYSDVHLLQTSGWARFKGHFGWSPARVQSESGAAQVLLRSLPLGYSIAYLPKGPVGTDWQALWPQVDGLCRAHKAVFLQVEPDLVEPFPTEVQEAWLPGFQVEEHPIQPRHTILIDLTRDEEALLAGMKQKTRYNIRLAERKGVRVETTRDLAGFYTLMQTTAARDGFALHDFSYYQKVFEVFEPLGKCVLLRASYEDQPLAYLMLFINQGRAWYFYGASDDESRNLMPTYLLQWEAMRWSKAHGASVYDLWGIPDEDEEVLERDFTNRSDGLWGVYRFKRGFGGTIVRSAPAFIRVYQPLIYRVYRWWRKRRQAGLDAAS